ncbi:transposase [Sphingobium sp. B11D3D]|nr:transposase [Sphingobium sp. B12D2B]MCW2368384.1 transposase [Sphingobium sp. B11D3D]
MLRFLQSEAQMRRSEPVFPLSHSVPRVDNRRIVSGMIYVIKHGLMWRDAPTDYGPHKTIYNRFIRWSRLGVFNRIFAELAAKAGKPDRIMIDTTHLKAHRTAASPLKGGGSFPIYRTHQRRSELEAPAVCDGLERPIMMLLTEGEMSDHKSTFCCFPPYLTPGNC